MKKKKLGLLEYATECEEWMLDVIGETVLVDKREVNRIKEKKKKARKYYKKETAWEEHEQDCRGGYPEAMVVAKSTVFWNALGVI